MLLLLLTVQKGSQKYLTPVCDSGAAVFKVQAVSHDVSAHFYSLK